MNQEMYKAAPAVGARLPRKLTIEFTDRCNLKCFICTREEFEDRNGTKGENLDLQHLHAIAPALAAAEVIQISGFGEVFLHPQMDEALDYIYSLNQRDNLIYMISNGTLLSRTWGEKLGNRLNYLAISLNAAQPESYRRDMHPYIYRYTRETAPAAYQGSGFADSNRSARDSEFDKTLDRIRAFMAGLPEAARSRVGLHFVSHRDNIDEMTDFVRLAHTLGVATVELNPYMVNRPENLEYSVYFEKERYNAAIDEARQVAADIGVRLHSRKFDEEPVRIFDPEKDCRWPFDEALISRFGSVVPCCHNGRGMMGDAFTEGFEQVWNGAEYQKLRTERWHDACQRCNPLQTFDDWRSHFHPVVKIDREFNSKNKDFAASQTTQRPEVLVLGAGRDGTKSVGRLVQTLYAANGQTVAHRHLGESFRLYDGVVDYVRTGKPERMAEIARDWSSAVVGGNGFAFVLPVLRDVLGTDLKVVHIQRDRATAIVALAHEARREPLYWGGFLEGYAPDGTPLPVIRPTAPLFLEIDEDAWSSLTLEARLGWYYDKTHALAQKDLAAYEHVLHLRTEDLDDPATVDRIAQFLDPSWNSRCDPVHINANYPVDLSALDDDQRRTVEHGLDNLDKRRLLTEPTYPIGVFIGLFFDRLGKMSDHDQALELNVLAGEVKNLRESADADTLDRTRSHGISEGSLDDRSLADLFGGLDGPQLAGGPIHPLLHFLKRLPSSDLGQRYPSAQLAEMYGHVFDSLTAAAKAAGIPLVV